MLHPNLGAVQFTIKLQKRVGSGSLKVPLAAMALISGAGFADFDDLKKPSMRLVAIYLWIFISFKMSVFTDDETIESS